MRASALAALAATCLAGCNGPKDSCQGSYDSYCSMLKGHDWDGMFQMLTAEHKKKAGRPERLAAFMEDSFKGTKDFSFNLQTLSESQTGVCVANGFMSYTIKLRAKNPEDVKDEYYSWTFRLARDGKWYMELPGEEKISGY